MKEVENVKKAILMPIIVLLALSMVLISPVRAITKEPYTSHMELELKEEGKRWLSEEGIFQIRDSYWVGTYDGTLGTGTYESWSNVRVDTATGKGTLKGKFRITIGTSTLSGTSRGKVTMPQFSGTFEGTLGTGDFKGVKIMGSFEGFHPGMPPDLTLVVMDAWGTIISP